jgi:hypothetical protein
MVQVSYSDPTVFEITVVVGAYLINYCFYVHVFILPNGSCKGLKIQDLVY